ncbi:MAG: hypothetical protein HY680_01665 [Chloroflexi bacterium]|nr:hypothetical protein [Chloroflexota bacterium]
MSSSLSRASTKETCQAFFVIGCNRSGTTAVVEMLKPATNADVFSEQEPKLCFETRDLIEGRLGDPCGLMQKVKGAYVNASVQKGRIYSDKNPNYAYFIPNLRNLWKCKFVFVIRNGRDSVRSMLDWHSVMHKYMYARPEDGPGFLTTRPEEDAWDYSRPRPKPGDPLFTGWSTASRLQKCAWFWATFNETTMCNLKQGEAQDWTMLDMTHVTLDTIGKLYGFLGLEGFNESSISQVLARRVNSVEERIGAADEFPHWDQWTDQQREEFDVVAGDMMRKLGYYA